MIEILITLAIGLIAGLAGMLLWWALLSDWWQGGAKKRRCPKCAYDMSGTSGLKCPECGRVAKSERQLHRSRRRWRLALVALAALTLASLLPVGVKVYREGWRSVLSSEQIAFVQSHRGQWDYSARGFWPRLNLWSESAEQTALDRWFLAAAVRRYCKLPDATQNPNFGSDIQRMLLGDAPEINADDIRQLLRSTAARHTSTRSSTTSPGAFKRVSVEQFIARYAPDPNASMSWEDWARPPDGTISEWYDPPALRLPRTISIEQAVERMLQSSDNSRELATMVATMRRLGCGDVLDAYWQRAKTASIEICTNAATALCDDTGQGSFIDRQRIAQEAIEVAPTPAIGLRRFAALCHVLPDPEPTMLDLVQRATAGDVAEVMDPKMFRLDSVRSSTRLFRALASHRTANPHLERLDAAVLNLDLTPDGALELLQRGERPDRSAVLLHMSRRLFFSKGDEFLRFRPILAKIASDPTESLNDRHNAITAIIDRTTPEQRSLPVAAE
ncbi:MAG: hypothetical protein K2X32_08425 [Phycisphaerales bacterium]|nr:hypothetical protein [Phycisphaerales bacterium]